MLNKILLLLAILFTTMIFYNAYRADQIYHNSMFPGPAIDVSETGGK